MRIFVVFVNLWLCLADEYSQLSGRNCILSCDNDRNRETAKVFNLPQNGRIRALFPFDAVLQIVGQPHLLQKYCSLNEEYYRMCIQECPSSTWKEVAFEVDTFNEFVCDEDKEEMIIDSFHCIFKMKPRVVCLESCQKQHQFATIFMAKYLEWILHHQFDLIMRNLPYVCSYMNCAMDCEFQTIEEQCGKDTLKLMQQFLLVTFIGSVLESLMLVDAIQDWDSSTWPQVCDVFMELIRTQLAISDLQTQNISDS